MNIEWIRPFPVSKMRRCVSITAWPVALLHLQPGCIILLTNPPPTIAVPPPQPDENKHVRAPYVPISFSSKEHGWACRIRIQKRKKCLASWRTPLAQAIAETTGVGGQNQGFKTKRFDPPVFPNAARPMFLESCSCLVLVPVHWQTGEEGRVRGGVNQTRPRRLIPVR